jgi:hypothetical protein
MTGQSLRLTSRANRDGDVEVEFLNTTVVLSTDQARTFVRQMATSLADAELRQRSHIEVMA